MRRPKCTVSEHVATASWASPANTLASTQRYSLERHDRVRSRGGYQVSYCVSSPALRTTSNRTYQHQGQTSYIKH
jgi:hypothetical protein